MRFVRDDLRDSSHLRKTTTAFRIGAMADPNGELVQNQHLRDFWGRSIFDFFNMG